MSELKTKISLIREAANCGNWREAIRIAAKFADLGAHKAAITRAWAAVQNPEFYRELGQEPAELFVAGVAALKARYGL